MHVPGGVDGDGQFVTVLGEQGEQFVLEGLARALDGDPHDASDTLLRCAVCVLQECDTGGTTCCPARATAGTARYSGSPAGASELVGPARTAKSLTLRHSYAMRTVNERHQYG
ncbi:hypothetical protein GCM10009837_50010 [Streptomyces durmitorensis]